MYAGRRTVEMTAAIYAARAKARAGLPLGK